MQNLPAPRPSGTPLPSSGTSEGGPVGDLMHQFWSEVAGRAKAAWDAGSLEPFVAADFTKYPITSLPGSAAAGIGTAYAKSVDQKPITKTAPGPGNPNAPRRLAQAKASGNVTQPKAPESVVIEERQEGRKASQSSDFTTATPRPWNDLRTRQVERSNRKRKGKKSS